MTAFNDTFGIIGLSSENVGIDRRIYTGLTSTNPQLNVSYNSGRVDVYLNGVKLMGNHSGQNHYDYTYQGTGAGSAITLSTGVALVATDTIECVGYVSNSSNTVTNYNPTPVADDGWNVFTSINHSASDLVNVFLNGVLLDDSDYTLDATNNKVTIGGATLTASDVVVIQVIGALDHSNFVPVGGGDFTGNVTTTGEIHTDDIKEKTSAHGVEIDGVSLKDGGGTFTAPLNVNTSTEDMAVFTGGIGALTLRHGIDLEFNRADTTYVTNNNASGSLQLRTGGQNNRLHITSAGKVGIGNDNPANTLSVHSTGQAIVRVDGADQYYTGVKIRNNHSSTQTDWNIGSAGGSSGWGSTNGNFIIRDDTTNSTGLEIEQGAGSNTPAVKINSAGSIVIGTAGQGIDFSATSHVTDMDEEVLNHYEWGVITRPVSFGGNLQGASDFSWNTSSYVRIGEIVHVNIAYDTQGSAHSSGAVAFHLPYQNINGLIIPVFGYDYPSWTDHVIEFARNGNSGTLYSSSFGSFSCGTDTRNIFNFCFSYRTQ